VSRREPSIQDLLAEPIIRALMARDGVSLEDLVSACDSARGRLGHGIIRQAERMTIVFHSQGDPQPRLQPPGA
jgi:hypothetical protein